MLNSVNIHASAVALNGRGVLILGEAGAGKSTLAMELMARGFELIGDDRIILKKMANQIWAEPHPKSGDRFEVRGIGIHQAHSAKAAEIVTVVNLNLEISKKRLPESEVYEQFRIKLPLIKGKHFYGLADYLYLRMTDQLKKIEVDKL